MGEILKRLSINKVVRYFYAGFLFLIGLIIYNKTEILPIIKDLGSVNTAICCFAIGAFFYTIYRYVIGELFLYWLVYIIHWLIELPLKEKLNVIAFLRENNVSFTKSRIYYNNLRRYIFNEEERKKLDYAHSEIHMMYLTSFVLVITVLYSKHFIENSIINNSYILIAGIVIFVAGIIMDVQQHRIEMRKMKYEIGNERLRKSFENIGTNYAPQQKI